MIESFKKSTIFFTNHDAALSIVKQTSLIINFIDKLNLRLVRAFEYIQRFNIIIKHKSDKQHIVSDVLFRLASENDENSFDSEELDALIITLIVINMMKLNALFITILIEINDEFKVKIINEYSIDSK